MADAAVMFFAWLEGLPLSTFIRESNSLLAFPFFLFLHTLGIGITVGGTAVISGALLGVWPRRSPLKPLERLYPLVYTGFWLEIVTGIVMFMNDATVYGRNPDLYWKLAFVAGAMVLLAAMRRTVFGDPRLDAGPVPARARLLAAASLVCWFVVIVTGRLIAYLNPQPVFF